MSNRDHPIRAWRRFAATVLASGALLVALSQAGAQQGIVAGVDGAESAESYPAVLHVACRSLLEAPPPTIWPVQKHDPACRTASRALADWLALPDHNDRHEDRAFAFLQNGAKDDAGRMMAVFGEAGRPFEVTGASHPSAWFSAADTALLTHDDTIANGATVGGQRCELSRAVRRRTGDPPPGTMFILRFNRNAPSDENQATSARRRDAASPGAGVVLSRPGGAYSLDWIGVAISAPIY